MLMASQFDTPDFKDLLKSWNEKLKESGFKDVEYRRGEELALKDNNGSSRYKALDETSRDHRVKFFELVSECIKQTQFENKRDRVIMKLFAKGHSQKYIQTRLGISGHRCKVYNPIYRYLREWGMK